MPMAIASRSWSSRPRRAEGHDDGVAAVGLDEPDRLLDRALLVRADDEAEELGVDVLRVGGQVDPAARGGDALDADEDVHASA